MTADMSRDIADAGLQNSMAIMANRDEDIESSDTVKISEEI